MKSLKLILKKTYLALPYFYFASITLYFFAKPFTHEINETLVSSLLMLAITFVFLAQLKYKFKQLDSILGIITLCWSCWMLLAFYSDFVNASPWTLNGKWVFLYSSFVIFNFYFSINLLTKKPGHQFQLRNGLQDWMAIGIATILVVSFQIILNY